MNDLISDKRCSKCRKIKPASEFSIRRSRVRKIERLDAWCKQCYCDNAAAYNALDPELKKQRQREYLARQTDEDRKTPQRPGR